VINPTQRHQPEYSSRSRCWTELPAGRSRRWMELPAVRLRRCAELLSSRSWRWAELLCVRNLLVEAAGAGDSLAVETGADFEASAGFTRPPAISGVAATRISCSEARTAKFSIAIHPPPASAASRPGITSKTAQKEVKMKENPSPERINFREPKWTILCMEVDRRLATTPCGGSFRHTIDVLTDMALDVEDSLKWLRSTDAFCDCEVVMKLAQAGLKSRAASE
jgi:hypothetical protein